MDESKPDSACARPTRSFPLGRTGTNAGYMAHFKAGEPACDACREGNRAYQREKRVWANPEESRERLRVAAREAWARKTSDYVGRPVCEIPTSKYLTGRTGTSAGYLAHWYKGEQACVPCLAAIAASIKRDRQRDPMAHRRVHIKSKFGISMADYEALLESQGGGCAVCGTPYPGHSGGTGRGGFHVDHDHDCCPGKRACGKCVRGLLCGPCNTGMGNLGDDPERLIAAANYLLEARKRRSDAETSTPAEAGDAA